MANSANQWTGLEHSVYSLFQAENLTQKSLLLAISGGADSVALLHILQRLSKALELKLGVVHIHHGPVVSQRSADELSESQSPHSQSQAQFRDQARNFVSELAGKLALPYCEARSASALRSEEELRNFRKSEIEKIRKQNGYDYSVWGHHQDDYLETQVMRLIRGTGEKGLTPMLSLRDFELRPLLQESKSEILNYLSHQNFQYLEDPSNRDSQYLRNWLRNSWLPQLEERCPGALNSLARSLALISEEKSPKLPEEIWLHASVQLCLSRPIYLTLNSPEKKQVLAEYLRKLGQAQFSHNQLLEVMKHLEMSQIVHTFPCAKMVWSLTEQTILAQSPSLVNEK